MPVEVRELVIRTHIEEGPRKPQVHDVDLEGLKAEVISACMQRLREIMEYEKNDR